MTVLDYQYARNRMVDAHVARRGVRDERVLAALRRVAREEFVEEGFQEFAYEDSPLPIGSGQTISQPFIVARMAEAAEVEPEDRVLEIGTGSGYAAAILAQLAAEVFTIERHGELAAQAQERLRAAGYTNVSVRIGDGTKGWPEKAPFDAILVAAGGPSVPVSLQEQLEIGGRLVIPVGPEPREQRLLRITRTGANKYEEEDLGGVMFVPLIGEEGWANERGRLREARKPLPRLIADAAEELPEIDDPEFAAAFERFAGRLREARKPLPRLIADAAEELPEIDDPEFAAAFERFAERRVVLLGESSHGTSEFYRARAAITKHLIERHGFGIVAVEADWPDAASLNRSVRGAPQAPEAEPPFRRFPTWMWRNTDVASFIGWLRRTTTRCPTSGTRQDSTGSTSTI